jgi:hypothetical protein
MTEEDLKGLYEKTIALPVLEAVQERIVVQYPPDRMMYGLGHEIIVELEDFKPKSVSFRKLCEQIGMLLIGNFPKAFIKIKVINFFIPARWDSERGYYEESFSPHS